MRVACIITFMYVLFVGADKVETIKKVMEGFSLPVSAMPEWAKHVPEDVWKTELLDGLHGKKHKTSS